MPRNKRQQKSKPKSRRTKGRDYARRAGLRNDLPRVLVVSGGEKTEVNYFEALRTDRRLPKQRVTITNARAGKDPGRLVDFAKRMAEKAERDEEPFDMVWCVFDKDQFEQVDEAIDRAEAGTEGQHRVAFSNPCFEVWYLLHFDSSHAPLTGYKAIARKLKAKKCLGRYDKAMDAYPLLKEKQSDAVSNAKTLRRYHRRHSPEPRPNPYTNVDELVEYINSLPTQAGPGCGPGSDRG